MGRQLDELSGSATFSIKMKYILVLLIVAASGCVTQKRCDMKYPTQNSRDSIYIEKFTEVPIFIDGDSIVVNVPIDCPDQDVALIENGKLKQVITILKGRLFSSTQIKPDTVFINVKQAETVVKEVKVPEPVKYVPSFYRILLLVNIGIVVLMLGYLYMKLKI